MNNRTVSHFNFPATWAVSHFQSCQRRNLYCPGPNLPTSSRRVDSWQAALSFAAAQLVRQFTNRPVVFLFAKAQRAGAEGLGVIGGGELAVVDEHKLVEDEVGDMPQLRHEGGMDA